MEYRKLGKSSLIISQIGFGTMSLELGSQESEKIIHKAVDKGINYFDTADIYNRGLNESFLGKALRDKRKNLILATKVGNKLRPDGSGLDWVPSKKYILAAVDQSLERLQTDYIDLYQLHGGTLADPIEEIIEAFEFLKSAGKIRSYGISSIRPNVIREYVKHSSIDSVMMQYSLLDRRPEESVFPLLNENGLGILARGVIAKGLLVNKKAEQFLNYSSDQVEKMSKAVKSVSKSNTFETAVQYVLAHKPVYSAVIGIRTDDQLNDALAPGVFSPMPFEEIKFLENILPVNKYTDHT